MKKITQTFKHFINDPRIRLIRFDKPIGTYLLVLPVLWSLMLSTPSGTQFFLWLPVFLIGAFAMRSAGCIVNDFLDVRYDIHVERTKSRPLAAGELSKRQAAEMLLVMLLIALACFITLPWQSQLISLLALAMTLCYPLAKRFTNSPQIFLGFTFNLGVIIAGLTIANQLSLSVVMLYIGAVFWTIGYDTIYALQDIEDDKRLGIGSLAITAGADLRRVVLRYYILSVGSIMISGINAKLNTAFLILSLVAMYMLFWQIKSLKLESKTDAAQKFKSNLWFGLVILLAIAIGRA